MNRPPPHSFSRSPVEEVYCRCTCGPDGESLSLAFPRPYPGWPHIRDRIRGMIAGAGEVSRITGCMLRYTDLIPVVNEKNLPGTEEIERVLFGRFDCSFDTSQNEIHRYGSRRPVVLVGTNIPNTAGSVCSLHNRRRKPGWTLIFTIRTEGPARFVSGDHVVNWFEDARAEIHDLFDLIVPDEIVQALR